MTREEVLIELAKRGIKVDISGCGCCGSPYVTIEIDGTKVIDSEENCNLNSLNE